MSIVEGQRRGPCLRVQAAAPRMDVVQARLAHLFTQQGQPEVLQSDRGACFVGAEAGSKAVPSRLTLWLWGLGIEHRLTPAGKPQRNGVVERFQGAIERSWAGARDGLAALVRVWNWDKPARTAARLPYRGRRGFRMAPVWVRLEQVRVERKVDRQGKLSLWDRPLRVGRQLADRVVSVSFDAGRQQVVLRDEREVWLRNLTVPWLTEAWLWEPVPLADQACDPQGTSTLR